MTMRPTQRLAAAAAGRAINRTSMANAAPRESSPDVDLRTRHSIDYDVGVLAMMSSHVSPTRPRRAM